MVAPGGLVCGVTGVFTGSGAAGDSDPLAFADAGSGATMGGVVVAGAGWLVEEPNLVGMHAPNIHTMDDKLVLRMKLFMNDCAPARL